MNTKHDKAAKQARLKNLRADLEKTSVELKKNRDSLIKIEERINEFSKAARASKYVFLAVHVYVYDIIACTWCTCVPASQMYVVNAHWVSSLPLQWLKDEGKQVQLALCCFPFLQGKDQYH